jgi:plastocyanin
VASSPKRCMTIKKGQTVAFEGDFTAHPLVASGGDTPTPFASVPATGKVTFAASGTFGFVCNVHPTMTGAIRVLE